ncbi:TIGR00645 family protein [Psychrobacter cibarius]|uniref:TIGR00645 family protein n=1 Tax=Psychrobacter cibarius TaxID=282669 RepID=UPI003FD092CA
MSMLRNIERYLEKTIFNSRWILAPFYLGLVLGIVLLFIKFIQKTVMMFNTVFSASVSDVIVNILVLVDLSLVASLLLIIIFSGYEIFVSKIDTGDHVDRPSWMGKVDFSGLKLKVIGAIVAISAIDLLKSFMDIPNELSEGEADKLMWKVIIHMTFVLSGLLFAIMDKVVGDTKKH